QETLIQKRTRPDSIVLNSNSTASVRRLLQHNPPESGLKSDIVGCPRMGWTGRAPAPNGFQSAPGACQERSTTMPRTTTLHAATAIERSADWGIVEAQDCAG